MKFFKLFSYVVSYLWFLEVVVSNWGNYILFYYLRLVLKFFDNKLKKFKV